MEHLELPITGMTCASCANRIERKLNKLDGVNASVNYALERAAVEFDPGAVAPAELVAAVEAAGYDATLPAAEPPATTEATDETAPLRFRLVLSAILSVPVLLIAMIPALQFDNWQWLSLQLATPVVIWGAWPFHRAAWANLKHGAATMDTLISLGVLAAWLWSLYALFLGDAGANEMRMSFELIPKAGAGAERDLPRDGVDRDDVHPRGPLLRGPCQAPCRCRAEGAAGARRQGRVDPRCGRQRAPRTGRAARCGRPLRRAARREGRHRWRSRRRHLRGRPIAAHGRVGAGREGAGRQRCGRERQRRRAAHHRGDAGRGGHRAGADRAPRVPGADRQGAGPAARRSHLGRVRTGRYRAVAGDARLLAGRRRGHRVRVHRGRGGPDHRLPLRAGARDADGAPCRHRPRRPARPAHQGPGDPRVHPPGRHDRARQDGHRHDGAHEPGRDRRATRPCCASQGP